MTYRTLVILTKILQLYFFDFEHLRTYHNYWLFVF